MGFAPLAAAASPPPLPERAARLAAASPPLPERAQRRVGAAAAPFATDMNLNMNRPPPPAARCNSAAILRQAGRSRGDLGEI